MAKAIPPEKTPAPQDGDFEDFPEEGAPASDEEQAQLEDFVMAALVLIYEEKQVRPQIAQMLDEEPSDLMAILNQQLLEEIEANPDPPPPAVIAVAATAVTIVLQLVSMADAPIPDEIIMEGGKQIVEELVDISNGLGNEIDQDAGNRAFLVATDLYREAAVSEGLVDEEALKAQFDEIVTADREGRLGEVLPALQKVNEAAAIDAERAAQEQGEPQ